MAARKLPRCYEKMKINLILTRSELDVFESWAKTLALSKDVKIGITDMSSHIQEQINKAREKDGK